MKYFTNNRLLSYSHLFVIASYSSVSFASDSFFKRYNLGVSYQSSASHAEILYDTPSTKQIPENCEQNKKRAGVLRCTAYLGPNEDDSTSFSIYIQKPFKREGFFYFAPGLTISTVAYKGGLISKPGTAPQGGSRTQGPTQEAPSQPLTKAYLEFYGLNWQAFLRFGITPPYLPDLFISFGGGLQTAGGRVGMFKESYVRYVVQPDVFAEAEAVFLRFKTGSLSVFYGQDQSFVSQLGTTLVEDYPGDSQLSNIRLGLSTGSAGARLLFPF